MVSTSRMAAVLVLAGVFVWLHPVPAAAQPTAYECLENPQLEGCSSSESTDKQEGTPPEEETMETDETETSLVWNIIKLIFALLFVIALIYGLLKFFNQKNKLFHRNKTMENLGGMTLGPNRSIQAVRIGTQVFILGVGESVEMITEITDERTKNTLLKQEDPQNLPPSFGVEQWLNKWKSKKHSKNSVAGSSSVQFQQLFENQLNDMKQKRKQAMDKDRRDHYHE